MKKRRITQYNLHETNLYKNQCLIIEVLHRCRIMQVLVYTSGLKHTKATE